MSKKVVLLLRTKSKRTLKSAMKEQSSIDLFYQKALTWTINIIESEPNSYFSRKMKPNILFDIFVINHDVWLNVFA